MDGDFPHRKKDPPSAKNQPQQQGTLWETAYPPPHHGGELTHQGAEMDSHEKALRDQLKEAEQEARAAATLYRQAVAVWDEALANQALRELARANKEANAIRRKLSIPTQLRLGSQKGR